MARQNVVNGRFNESEAAIAAAIAEHRGVTRSVLIRELVLEEADRLDVGTPEEINEGEKS